MSVADAMISTRGTNNPATLSEKRWTGARLIWASHTALTILARDVFSPVPVTRKVRTPFRFMVPE